jgi:hypothetical protein
MVLNRASHAVELLQYAGYRPVYLVRHSGDTRLMIRGGIICTVDQDDCTADAVVTINLTLTLGTITVSLGFHQQEIERLPQVLNASPALVAGTHLRDRKQPAI